jgi:hypothetical protein
MYKQSSSHQCNKHTRGFKGMTAMSGYNKNPSSIDSINYLSRHINSLHNARDFIRGA